MVNQNQLVIAQHLPFLIIRRDGLEEGWKSRNGAASWEGGLGMFCSDLQGFQTQLRSDDQLLANIMDALLIK